MVYSNKFIMCILLNGCPQKELANGVVTLPFGTEYSLRFRNKNNRRAVVQIYIDGENVSGSGYIVNANDYVDIKRHHDVDRSFKFVSLDSPDAVDHGKNGPNNDKIKGTIEARFFLEKETPNVIYRDVHHHHHDYYYPKPRPIIPHPQPWYNTCDGLKSSGSDFGVTNDAMNSTSENAASASSMSMGMSSSLRSSNVKRSRTKSNIEFYSASPEQLQDGCTVEGHVTGQSFRSVSCDTESTYTSVKIFLQGHDEDVVKKPKKSKKKKGSIQKTIKQNNAIFDLEDENESLKEEIEELKYQKKRKEEERLLKEENEKLKRELEELKQ